MIKQGEKIHRFKEGAIAGIPIVIGYIPIAMAFGILSKTIGISMLDSFLFSVFVFAGASQFMALNLLNVGAGMGEIVLTTLLVNFRHFLMSASFATKMTKDMKKWIPFIAFGITDEIFSVASFKKGQITKEFIISLQLVSYFAWISGTALGYLVGGLLPVLIKNSMGIALYAMFVAILIPEAKRSNKVAILALLSGVINTLLNYFQWLPTGWNMILAIILVSIIGSYSQKEKDVCVYE